MMQKALQSWQRLPKARWHKAELLIWYNGLWGSVPLQAVFICIRASGECHYPDLFCWDVLWQCRQSFQRDQMYQNLCTENCRSLLYFCPSKSFIIIFSCILPKKHPEARPIRSYPEMLSIDWPDRSIKSAERVSAIACATFFVLPWWTERNRIAAFIEEFSFLL